jgi:two-component system, OmpR family, response regulator
MAIVQRPVSVFLVDDDRMTLSSIKHSLAEKFRNDITVTEFATGEECLKKIDEEPDVVVLDYYLNSENPEAMNGIQVLKRIRAQSKDTQVVMLSEQNNLDVVADSFKNDAFEYVPKNESTNLRLENTIKHVIALVRSTREAWKYEIWNYAMGAVLLLVLMYIFFYPGLLIK